MFKKIMSRRPDVYSAFPVYQAYATWHSNGAQYEVAMLFTKDWRARLYLSKVKPRVIKRRFRSKRRAGTK